MIVLDASAVLDMLLQRDRHEAIGALVREQDACSVELLVPEVLSALRRLEHQDAIDPGRAAQAVGDLVDLPVELYPLAPLTEAVWALRADITAYDASYVAIAAALDATLVTTDDRLARTAVRHCPVVDWRAAADDT